MTDYRPGTVAIVTMRRPDEWESDLESGPYLAFYDGYHKRWISAEAGDLSPEGAFWVYEVKPLLVLDLDGLGATPERLAEWMRELRDYYGGFALSTDTRALLAGLADQIDEQTKPPRIPEPRWGEKVEASVESEAATFRRVFLRSRVEGNRTWVTETGGRYRWDDLVDPTLVTEDLS